MPRYFFDFDDGVLEPDYEGVSLPNLAAAKREAQEALAEILKEQRSLGENFSLTARVRDQAGAIVFEVTISLEFRAAALERA